MQPISDLKLEAEELVKDMQKKKKEEWRRYAWNLHPYAGHMLHDVSPEQYRPVRSDGTVHIGIIGGSVARFLLEDEKAIDLLREKLQEHPSFAEKSIVIHPLAVQGYKQPQQFLLMSYLLSLGAEFDILVNLDGFNELAIADRQVLRNASPYYPGYWTKDGLYEQRISASIKSAIVSLRDLREKSAEGFATSRWNSPTMAYFWIGYQSLLEHREAHYMQKVEDGGHGKGRVTEVVGPTYHLEKRSDAFFEDVTNVWERSSVMLHRLLEEHDTLYIQAIQPNQYVPNSKPLNKQERKFHYNLRQSHRKVIERGYPWLRSRTNSLQAQGVRLYDLTMLFENEERTVYRDSCCHFNVLGHLQLAEALARAILEHAE